MALELFLNFERSSNKGMFYRETSSANFNGVFEVKENADNSITSDFLGKNYSLKYKINNGPESELYFGEKKPFSFVRESPCVSAVHVDVYLVDGTFVDTLSLSANFIPYFPEIDFLVYPTLWIDEEKNKIIELSASNITSEMSPGYGVVHFYGEGHTEIINLSARAFNTNNISEIKWFVGDKFDNLLTDSVTQTAISLQGNSILPQSYNNESSSGNIGIGLQNLPQYIRGHVRSLTTTVKLTSSPKEHRLVPISVLATNEYIALTGKKLSTKTLMIASPNSLSSTSQSNDLSAITTSFFETAPIPVVRYDDLNGTPSFYPFFNSTLEPVLIGAPVHKVDAKKYPNKRSIEIRPYPNLKFYSFRPPFNESIALSPDNTASSFTSLLSPISTKPFLSHSLSSTIWSLDYFSDKTDWSYSTKSLTKIIRYEFPLQYASYQQELESLPIFSISPIESTTIVHRVSALRSVFLDYFPNDWIRRDMTEVHETIATIPPLPFIELYIPNYYVEKYEPIFVKSINVYSGQGVQLFKVQLLTEESNKIIELSGQNLADKLLANPFELVFENIGLQSLTALSVFEETNGTNTITAVNVFPNIIEVVEKYDNTLNNTIEYKSKNSLVNIDYSFSEFPKIAPGEWLIEDNINYILRQIYNKLEQIIKNATYFDKGQNFTGWLGNAVYAWSDLECFNLREKINSWSKFVIKETLDNPENEPLRWSQHECFPGIGDPDCIQKYCIEWKWSSRKGETSSIHTTWKSTQAKQRLSKKWQYEPCELDARTLSCELGSWHISSIDKEFFPLSFCSSRDNCDIISFCKLRENRFVLARKEEIILIDESYNPQVFSKKEMSDEIFSFANIVKLAVSSENQVFVLDSVIPKITVYDAKNDNLVFFTSWGSFGSRKNPYGFNKPSDLHIDQSDNIWVVDTGNYCIKQYTTSGKHKNTFEFDQFNKSNQPISLVVDSTKLIHILTTTNTVYVFNEQMNYLSEYKIDSKIQNPTKLNTSYNREIIYVTHNDGIIKYFRTGALYGDLIYKFNCINGRTITNFYGVFQDQYRNTYICTKDKVLKFADRMNLIERRLLPKYSVWWNLSDILIHSGEYVQPWVYLRSFHRLWDNIELIRNSLIYDFENSATTPSKPKYLKTDLCIGQNELVTDSTLNRLSFQLWSNTESLISFITRSA
jgi:hypothetical protein